MGCDLRVISLCVFGHPCTVLKCFDPAPSNRHRDCRPHSNTALSPSEQVITSINAGTDTTASTLTRMLQLLATADDGKEITASLRSELSNEATTSDDNELDDTTGTGKGGASREGILGAFPLLDAVILETFR